MSLTFIWVVFIQFCIIKFSRKHRKWIFWSTHPYFFNKITDVCQMIYKTLLLFLFHNRLDSGSSRKMAAKLVQFCLLAFILVGSEAWEWNLGQIRSISIWILFKTFSSNLKKCHKSFDVWGKISLSISNDNPNFQTETRSKVLWS